MASAAHAELMAFSPKHAMTKDAARVLGALLQENTRQTMAREQAEDIP